MSPHKTTVKAAGRKNHKRLDHIPPHLFRHGFKPLRRPSWSNPVANGPNIQDPQVTGQITDGEETPRSIASPELSEHPWFPPVGMAIPVHAGRRTPYPSSIRHNPWGYTRQRPRVNLGSEESNLTYSSNMAQVAGPNSQFVTQVQDISGSHVPQPAPQLNPFRFAYSQADYYSPDPNAGVQQPWTSASAAPIYPIYHDPPCAVDSTASFQPPEALPEATQNQTVPSTSYYPYNDSPLHYFPDVDNPMPLHVSIATSSLQFAIPVQQATPDTLPVNVDSMTAFF